MINIDNKKSDRNSIFIFLVIIFQCFHALPIGSFRIEFLIQLIPYLFIYKWFLNPNNYLKIFDKDFIYLTLLNCICFLSLFWTTDLKYTLASNFELILTSLTLYYLVNYYKNNNNNNIENSLIASLNAIYLILIVGIFSINITDRTFLNMSPSLFSSILCYGFVCSLYLFHRKNKKLYLIPSLIFLIFNILISSLRGVFPIIFGFTAYLKIFKSKSEKKYYLKILFTFILLAIIYILFILNVDLYGLYSAIHSEKEFAILTRIFENILTRIFENSKELKKILLDIFVDNKLQLSNYSYAGDRLGSFLYGFKETLFKSPFIGFGHGNSKLIYSTFDKSYSHNGILEIFVGTGIIGTFCYLKFLRNSLFKKVKKLNLNLINWKRYAVIIFCTHLMLGLPYENIPLTLLLALIISI